MSVGEEENERESVAVFPNGLESESYGATASNSSTSSTDENTNGRSSSIDEPQTPFYPRPLKSHDERLLELTNQTSYTIVQRNGQRIYGGPPPDWRGQPPCKGCEVFVGKVPRDCYEDELVPIFSKIGPIYELRLMMDFSGSNRGYLFVRYTNREDAKKAAKELNNYEIRPNKFIGVVNSVDNRKLWISGIPKNHSAEEIKSEMEKLTEGVHEVILYQSQTDKSKTRGYAFVEYESHRAAALARRKLVPGKIYLFAQEIEKVDWAEPENEVDEEIMSKVRILFVRNLMPVTSEAQIRAVFENLSGGEVERVKKTKDYAFVHFATREAAEEAMSKSQGLNLDNSFIEVSWSKPVDKQIYNTRKTLTKLFSQNPGHGRGVRHGMLNDSPLSQLNGHFGHASPQMPHAYQQPPMKLTHMNGFAHANGLPHHSGGFPPPPLGPRGAPGTALPRRLVKMANGGLGESNGVGGDFFNGMGCHQNGYALGSPHANHVHPQPLHYPPTAHAGFFNSPIHLERYFQHVGAGVNYVPGNQPHDRFTDQMQMAFSLMSLGNGSGATANGPRQDGPDGF